MGFKETLKGLQGDLERLGEFSGDLMDVTRIFKRFEDFKRIQENVVGLGYVSGVAESP